jgi:hypothetical protein
MHDGSDMMYVIDTIDCDREAVIDSFNNTTQLLDMARLIKTQRFSGLIDMCKNKKCLAAEAIIG